MDVLPAPLQPARTKMPDGTAAARSATRATHAPGRCLLLGLRRRRLPNRDACERARLQREYGFDLLRGIWTLQALVQRVELRREQVEVRHLRLGETLVGVHGH